MATIGTFTLADCTYSGAIKTLTLNVRNAQLRPNEKVDEKAPDFRFDRVRHRLEEDLASQPRLSLGQAGRSEFPGADLRLPDRDRRRFQPDLVAQLRTRRRRKAPPPPFTLIQEGGGFALYTPILAVGA